jgi:RHS repeat-associated protein
LTAKYAYKTKEYSPETGLIFFGARYYNPLIGRFITKDPLGQIDGPNVYIYCNNDPVNKYDPWGLAKDDGFVKGAYEFIKYAGDNFHGGEHWHVLSRRTGGELGKVSVAGGKVLTGAVPKTAIKFLIKFGKISGVASVISLLAEPTVLGADDMVYPEEEVPVVELEPINVTMSCKGEIVDIR